MAMMYSFLANNRDELVARCKTKVAGRPKRHATEEQLKNGIPLFLEQLRRTLQAEEADEDAASLAISGASGGDVLSISEVGVSAAAHGKELLHLGFSINQVVHDYGDLCQAITELAFERDAPFTISEFRTLNRCLDNAIADAVTEFSSQRDANLARLQYAAVNQRIGFLVHELRNALATAMLATRALEEGNLPIVGATGGVLKRSHASLKKLIDHSLDEVRTASGSALYAKTFSVSEFVTDAKNAAELDAVSKGCTLVVPVVDPLLAISGDRDAILGALINLLHNAFKFTHPLTEVTLRAHAAGTDVLIEVEDHCGGLTDGAAEGMFKPFAQRGGDRTGVGLGLSIARRSVETDGGTLKVRDLPHIGCVFTISLPLHTLPG
jgi:signal transduction histidine kinase